MKILVVLAVLVVAAQGQEHEILKDPGIIETDKEQCEKELFRYQTWDYRIMFGEDRVRSYYNRLLPQIDRAFNNHADLLMKMDNYSSYQTAIPDLRGQGEYTDCSDLCPSKTFRVGAIALENITHERKRDICFVVKPQLQNFQYQSCMYKMAENVPDSRDFQMKYACVPDGFIRRKLIVFCPDAPMGQCREVEVSVPMACSPKLAKCTFTKEYMLKKIQKKKRGKTINKPTKKNNYLKGLFKI